MKTRIILFAVAVLALLSFTFVNGNESKSEPTSTEQQIASSSEGQRGIILEDKAEW